MKKIIFRSKNLKVPFNAILNKWLQMVEKYTCNIDPDDALYWYNERATLSSLAGAIWKCDFQALEEYYFYKKKKNKWKTGRIDLWMNCFGTEYIVEAKQKFVSISPRASKTIEKLSLSLEQAKKDAKASRHDCIGLGILFAVPYVSPSDQSKTEFLVKEFLKRVEDIEYDFLAYWFNPNSQILASDEDGYTYPGVALVVSQIK